MRAVTPTDAGERRLGSQMLRQGSEKSRQQQITSSSESAAAGVYDTSPGRADAEEATSQARRQSQSVGEEAASLGPAVRRRSGNLPAHGNERVGSAPGPSGKTSPSSGAASRFLDSAAAQGFAAVLSRGEL